MGLGHVLEADALGDAAELDLAHEHVVLAVGLDHLAGDAEAHRRSSGGRDSAAPARGDGELAQAQAAVVGRHEAMAVDAEAVARSAARRTSRVEQGVQEHAAAQDDARRSQSSSRSRPQTSATISDHASSGTAGRSARLRLLLAHRRDSANQRPGVDDREWPAVSFAASSIANGYGPSSGVTPVASHSSSIAACPS